MTNFERISDGLKSPDGLAAFLQKAEDGVEMPYCENKAECCERMEAGYFVAKKDCMECLLKWLAEEETV